MENEMSFKSTISDNLSDFKTISKLLSNNNFDVENIKYISDSAINYIENFIKIENKEESLSEEKSIGEYGFLKDYKIEDIKSYDDIIEVLYPEDNILPFNNPITLKQKSINAYSKLINIVKVFNAGWIPDWDNEKEYKYYPYFYMDSKEGGFRLNDVNCHVVTSGVTARLCFKTKELAQLSVDLFFDIYKDYFEYK